MKRDIILDIHDSVHDLPDRDSRILKFNKPHILSQESVLRNVEIVDYKKGNPVGATCWIYAEDIVDKLKDKKKDIHIV